MTRLLFFFLLLISTQRAAAQGTTADFISYIADPATIEFHWKDDSGNILESIARLKQVVETGDKKLLFACNGGMYKKDSSPQGLYIENSKTLSPLDTASGPGNFYLKPNGVFYLTQTNRAVVCTTNDFYDTGDVKFATQSGPLLLINGAIHPAFKQGSSNRNIRNGVGILPDGKVVFAISTKPVNFYDFAIFFKDLHCNNALYLDGFVSRAYLPEKNWIQLDGNFGVMIAVTH